MEMTLEQYILNPMGKNNAVLNAVAREAIRNDYVSKFNNILVRERGRIEYHLYKDSKNNRYYAHFKIPSEVVEKFYYDTVLEFYTDSNVLEGGNNLFKYFVKFYSNDPSFVYTYAHVFNKNKLFIEALRPKMATKALKEAPKEKNESNQVGYVKSLYFAFLTMNNWSLNRLDKFVGESIELDIPYLLSQIRDADTKIEARQEAGAKATVTKKKKQPDTTNRIVSNRTDRNNNLGVKRTGSISSTSKNTKSVNGVKSVKRK